MRTITVVLCFVALWIYAAEPAVPLHGEINSLIPVRAGRGKRSEHTFILQAGKTLEITWLKLPSNCPVMVECPDGRILKSGADREFTPLHDKMGGDMFSRALHPVLVFELKGESAVPGRYRIVVGPAAWWRKISAVMVIAAVKGQPDE